MVQSVPVEFELLASVKSPDLCFRLVKSAKKSREAFLANG